MLKGLFDIRGQTLQIRWSIITPAIIEDNCKLNKLKFLTHINNIINNLSSENKENNLCEFLNFLEKQTIIIQDLINVSC